MKLEPEPVDFDEKVRKPGCQWLSNQNIPLDQPPPASSRLPPYWRDCQKALWDAYRGICAYLCIYFAWPLGASSTDHFIAKSRDAGHAYEWSNYRLSCLGMNRMKNRFDDILDPFAIKPNTFVLNLASGAIKPNPRLPAESKDKARQTVKRLKLDSPETNRMRADHYTEYLRNQVSEDWLKRNSPFVWYEAKRQNLL